MEFHYSITVKIHFQEILRYFTQKINVQPKMLFVRVDVTRFSATLKKSPIDYYHVSWYNGKQTMKGGIFMPEKENMAKRPLNVGLLAHVDAERTMPVPFAGQKSLIACR